MTLSCSSPRVLIEFDDLALPVLVVGTSVACSSSGIKPLSQPTKHSPCTSEAKLLIFCHSHNRISGGFAWAGYCSVQIYPLCLWICCGCMYIQAHGCIWLWVYWSTLSIVNPVKYYFCSSDSLSLSLSLSLPLSLSPSLSPSLPPSILSHSSATIYHHTLFITCIHEQGSSSEDKGQST